MPWKKDANGNWIKGDAPAGAAPDTPKVNVPTPLAAKSTSTKYAPQKKPVPKALARTTDSTQPKSTIPKNIVPQAPAPKPFTLQKCAPPPPPPTQKNAPQVSESKSSERKSTTPEAPAFRMASEPKVTASEVSTAPAPTSKVVESKKSVSKALVSHQVKEMKGMEPKSSTTLTPAPSPKVVKPRASAPKACTPPKVHKPKVMTSKAPILPPTALEIAETKPSAPRIDPLAPVPKIPASKETDATGSSSLESAPKSLAPKALAPPMIAELSEPQQKVPQLSAPSTTDFKPLETRSLAPKSNVSRARDPPPAAYESVPTQHSFPPRPDPFDDISFDGTYLTSVTTEEVYNPRTGIVERKTVSGSGRSQEHHYYNDGAGNPAAYNEEEEDNRSMSSMSMLFRKARGGRYTEPVQSTNYANYQMDDDATVDSFSSIFGLMKYPAKATPQTNTLSHMDDDYDDDDDLAGIIGDVANLHDNDIFDHLDSIEPDPDVPHVSAYNLADISELHDPEEQYEQSPQKLMDVSIEEKSTSSGSQTDDVYSLDSTSTSSSLRNTNKRGKTNKIMCIIISVFVVLSIISVIVFAEVNKKKGRIDDSLDNKRDTNSPKLRVPTQAPLSPEQTYAPTMAASTTKSPTWSTAQRPTNGANVNFIDPIMNFLEENEIFFDRDPLSPEFMAVQWLADEAQIRSDDDEIISAYGNGLELSSKLIQRFALLTLDFALMRSEAPYATKMMRSKLPYSAANAEYTKYERETYARSNTIAVKYQNECQWIGVHCAVAGDLAGEVTEINFSHSGLTGTIPKEVKLFKNLKKLHLAGNKILGTIPSTLFDIEGLQHLYLYQNRLTGTIPNNIGNIWNMTRLHLSHNELSGSIPESFKSIDGRIRPIEYLNLHSNKFTGTIPEDLRFSMIKFIDLGRNNFSGNLPEDIGEEWFELRYLYLDHNEFTGTIPKSYPTTGEGRVETMTFNHNNLEGLVPGGFKFNKLLEFNVQDNIFTGIDKKVCKQSIFGAGEMVEYKTDCKICKCDPFCELKCEV